MSGTCQLLRATCRGLEVGIRRVGKGWVGAAVGPWSRFIGLVPKDTGYIFNLEAPLTLRYSFPPYPAVSREKYPHEHQISVFVVAVVCAGQNMSILVTTGQVYWYLSLRSVKVGRWFSRIGFTETKGTPPGEDSQGVYPVYSRFRVGSSCVHVGC